MIEPAERKKHWDHIYTVRKFEEVSWFQSKPTVSLDLINTLQPDKTKSIIDIGGGDSFLVDFLLEDGYQDVTVLDISEKAIERAQARLGDNANKVNWIVSDITNFNADREYDLWHDRAVFHFLGSQDNIQAYIKNTQSGIKANGHLVIGTFSDTGPDKCSGIEISKYSTIELKQVFEKGFKNIECFNLDHVTPSGKVQNFSFCSFTKLANKRD
ncbi:MAG: class I SAM-dependent methyltransferase [Saprospiraceae bacterium]|nr:class I SAM-dependent methyltransferase [Saprospiraceae bacterium]